MRSWLLGFIAFFPMEAVADPLPLQHGVFVLTSTACPKPPNAFTLTYLGNYLVDGYYACGILDSSNVGTRYVAQLACVPKHEGASFNLPMATFIVSDPQHFSLDRGSNGRSEDYRWCGDDLKSLGD